MEFGQRKRKSNFDVGPEAVMPSAANDFTTYLNLANVDEANVNALKEVDRLRNQFNTSFSDVPTVFMVATDPAFLVRLEKAMIKNFEYILRYYCHKMQFN
jgi:hypothetical protein